MLKAAAALETRLGGLIKMSMCAQRGPGLRSAGTELGTPARTVGKASDRETQTLLTARTAVGPVT